MAAVVLGALVLAALFLRTGTQSFRAPSGSMEPAIPQDSRFTLNEDAYAGAGPQRRDIVVLHPPPGAVGGAQKCGEPVRARALCPRPTSGVAEDVTLVKRVVGLPGERFGVRDGRAVVDGRPLDEPYANLDYCLADTCTFRGAITIPENHFFLMGDNRGASDDSRFWGPVPRDQILGRVDDCLPFGLRCKEDDRTG